MSKVKITQLQKLSWSHGC